MITSLSIVYPMYNEKDNIIDAVTEGLRVGRQLTSQLEIIVVDDASTDGSGEIAEALAVRYAEVRVLHHTHNRKLGGALRTGFAAARHDWILYIDSDLPLRMDDIVIAESLTAHADIIIAWRKIRGENWMRKVMSFCYNRLIRLTFHMKVRDINFSFKLFKRSLYEQFTLTSEGSFIDAELLLEMRRVGAVLAEVGLNCYPRKAGVSTLARLGIILKILAEMSQYWLRRHTKPVNQHWQLQEVPPRQPRERDML